MMEEVVWVVGGIYRRMKARVVGQFEQNKLKERKRVTVPRAYMS